MICGKCGKEIPEGAAFCCWCGVRCAGKICKACGTKLRSDQLFCHECGVRWSGGEMQDMEQPYMKAPSPQEEHELSGKTGNKTTDMDTGSFWEGISVVWRKGRETTDADHRLKEFKEIEEHFIDIYCPFCQAVLSYTDWQIEKGNLICPMCNGEFEFSEGIRIFR